MNHDCCSPTNKKVPKVNGPDKFIVGIIVVTALMLGLAVLFGSRMGATSKITADTLAALAVSSNKFDWETIDIDGGIVSKSFEIKNTGESILKLYDVKTSCMCTTAQLRTASRTSPKFKMHEKSLSVFEVEPGETAELIVEFDPAFHGPSGVGSVTRTINVSTNDTNNPILAFNLVGNVIKK